MLTKSILISADRIGDTDDERAWLDLVDAVSKVVYGPNNGWHDVINVQMTRSEEQ